MVAPRTAGFASVTSMGQDLANDILAAAASSVTLPSFSLPDIVTVGADQVGLSGKLSLIPPQVTFARNTSNLITVDFGCTGWLQLTSNGTSLIEIGATLKAVVKLGLTVDLTPHSLTIAIDASTAKVTSVSVEVDAGPPLVPVYQKALNSGSALAAFTAAIRSIPKKALTLAVPGAKGTFDVAYGGIAVSLTISRLVVVPVDGALNVAADVSPYTTGDETNLVNLIATQSPTPIYFNYDQFGDEDGPLGGMFGPHTGVGIEDGYADSYGTNLAVAVNSDFFCAVVGGPLSSKLSHTLLSIDGTVLSPSHTVVHGDTHGSIAKSICDQFNSQPTSQYLALVGISVTVSGAVITLSSPASVLPPQFSGGATPPGGSPAGTKATEKLATGGSGPTNTITIEGHLTPGDTVTVNLPVGGVEIRDISLSVAGVNNSDAAQSSPTLPTNWYPCLVLTLDGVLISFAQVPKENPDQPGPNLNPVSMDGIDVTFTASMCPMLIQRPSSAYWDFVLVDWSVSAPLLTFIDDFFPLGPFLFAGAINAAVDSIVANSLYRHLSYDQSLYGSAPFPGVKGSTISFNVCGLVICPPQNDPLYAGAELDAYAAVSISGQASASSPSKPQFSLFADDGNSLSSLSPIQVELTMTGGNAHSLLDAALGLRIHWTAKRNDTGAQVLHQDTSLTPSSSQIEITRADGPTGDLIFNDTWTVTCEVYRPADTLVPRFSYFKGAIQVGLQDVVDRRHPYVEWQHEVFIHDPHGPGPLKQHHFWTRNRKSKIHRTDLLIRCSMLDRAMSKTPPVQYLDTLAHYGSLEQLTTPHLVPKGRHKVLCDYCFFGGPTKSVWLTPTAPTPKWV